MTQEKDKPSTRPSAYALDRVRVGEATDAEGNALEAHLHDNDRIEALKELRQKTGFAAFKRQQSRRLAALQEETTPSWLDWLHFQRGPIVAFTCVAALVFVLGNKSQTNQHAQMHPPRKPPVRITRKAPPKRLLTAKGTCKATHSICFRTLLYRKGDPYPKWIRDGYKVPIHTFIQFHYQSQKDVSIAILGMNREGEVYAFAPYLGKASIKTTKAKGTFPQKSSLQLDDYTGLERIFFVWHSTPFTIKDVKRSLQESFDKHGRDLRRLTSLKGPWQSTTILIHKTTTQAIAPGQKR